ncbi:MAG: class I SAM-dependent methyltransferase [Tissierellia bacterium]|nr:class I SAM-dependent methyltransferase [Tissierellia bacterium]
MEKEPKNKIQKRYDRIAPIYDLFANPMEAMALKKWRLEVMQELGGKVLEVGVGTGKNIEYYPTEIDITAIDFSEMMLDRARNRAEKLGREVEFINMDVEDMDFLDNTFDTVFTTCVFCSVPNPIKGLREIGRVCKPDGKIVMIEHVRSEQKFLGPIMDLLNPLTVNIYGANINRRTVENIHEAGYTDFEVSNLSGDILKKIIIYNKK